MRIIHTSDWHLGRTLEGRTRLPEQRAFIEELCSIVEQENIDLLLIAGDVFDTYNPPAEAEELFYEALDRLNGNGRRAIVVIAGNHDSPDRLHAANPLANKHGIFILGYPGETPGAGMQPSRDKIHTSGNSQDLAKSQDPDNGLRVSQISGGPGWLEIAVPGCLEHAVVVALPYPSEQRLNEVLTENLEENEIQKAYSERVALAFSQPAAHFRPDTVNIGLSHIFVLGGQNSESERDVSLGGAYLVEPAHLPDRAHYLALGHLHRPQKVGGVPVPCRYSGSPLAYSFSESDQQKEVVLVEAYPGTEAVIKPIKLNAGMPMKSLQFNSYEEAFEWCEVTANRAAWIDMKIRIPEPLKGSQISALRKLHPGIINIQVILPGLYVSANGNHRLSELSLEEKFTRFVAGETGEAPARELFTLFLELLEGGDEVETD